MRITLTLGAALFVAVAMTSSVRADAPDSGTFGLTIPNMTPGSAVGDLVSVYGKGGVGGYQSTAAGPYQYNLTGVDSADAAVLGLNGSGPTYSGTVYGFCIQLLTDIYVGTSNPGFKLSSMIPSNVATPGQVSDLLYLMKEYSSSPTNGMFNVQAGAANSANAAKGDALTIAIWEVLNGTGTDTSGQDYNIIGYSGTNTPASPSPNDITVHFATADVTPSGAPTGLPSTDLYALLNDTVQDQTVTFVTGGGNSNPVPEPNDAKSLVGLVFLGLAAGATVIIRRRPAVAGSSRT
jgi:hypothetical protein